MGSSNDAGSESRLYMNEPSAHIMNSYSVHVHRSNVLDAQALLEELDYHLELAPFCRLAAVRDRDRLVCLDVEGASIERRRGVVTSELLWGVAGHGVGVGVGMGEEEKEGSVKKSVESPSACRIGG